MKIRAFLLIILMVAGTYAMIQSIQDNEKKAFAALLNAMHEPFNSIVFSRPSPSGKGEETWIVDEAHEIEALLTFLENVQVRKLSAEEINPDDDINDFSISLKDAEGKLISIMIHEELIIQNDLLYYQVVDEPLDIEWLVQFFLHNQL